MRPSVQRRSLPMVGRTTAMQLRSRAVCIYRGAVTSDSPVQCVADVHAVLGEGPVWVARERALYWVDVDGRRIFRLDGSGKLSAWETPFRVGSLAPRTSGGFIAGTDQGIAEIDPESGRVDAVVKPDGMLPNDRFNDGKVDRPGRFWAGTMDDRELEPRGTLYLVEQGARLTQVDSGYRVTNGPAFSPSGDIMYHNDSARLVTYVFDIGADGAATNRRTFLKFNPG